MTIRIGGFLIALLCVTLAGCAGEPPRQAQMVVTAPSAFGVKPEKIMALGPVTGGQGRQDGSGNSFSAITEQDLRAAVEGSLQASGLLWSEAGAAPRALDVTFVRVVHQRRGNAADVAATIDFSVREADGKVSFQKTVVNTGSSSCFCFKPAWEATQEASERAIRGAIRQFLEAWLASP